MIDKIEISSNLNTMFFLVRESTIKQTNRGSPYVRLDLADRTGTIEAVIWNDNTQIDKDSFIKASFFCEDYKGKTQLKITKWRIAESSEINIDDFIRKSLNDIDEMYSILCNNILSIADEKLRLLVSSCIGTNRQSYCKAPAAKSHHHVFIGGLLEHAVNLCSIAYGLGIAYGQHAKTAMGIAYGQHAKTAIKIDTDLLIAAAILHDIGKIRELTYKTSINYSVEGSLLGHITIGLAIIYQEAFSLGISEDTKVLELMHIIASHHGRKEWGSPVEPMSLEANIFHQMDMIDSRVGSFNEMKKTGVFRNMGQYVYIRANK